MYYLEHEMTRCTPCNIAGRWFSPSFATNKTDRHDITEILFKVAFNTGSSNVLLGFLVNDCVPMGTYMHRNPCKYHMFTNSNKAFINFNNF